MTISAFIDLKKTILFWLPFKLLFNNQIAIRYESPGIALVVAVDIMLLGVFLLKRKSKVFYRGEFLFRKSFIVFLVSYAISSLFTIAPIMTAAIASVKFFCTGFCMVYLAHKCFNSLEDIKLFVKFSIVVSIFIIALALSENIFKTNIWLDFVFFNSPFDPTSGRMFYMPGSLEIRYGLVRSRSFFSFHIPFGYACLCLYWLIFYFYRYGANITKKNISVIVSFLLIAGVLMSNSKQVYVGFLVMFFSLYPFKAVFQPKLIIPVVLASIAVIVYVPDYLNNIFSLTNEQLAEEGGGSTIALRETQYMIAFDMFAQNPLIGNGVAALSVLKQNMAFEGILGAESVWLSILPELGLLGAFAYLYMYYSIWNGNKFMSKKVLLFFLLSIIVVEFAGGLKDISIWGVVLVAVYRYNQISKLKKISYV